MRIIFSGFDWVYLMIGILCYMSFSGYSQNASRMSRPNIIFILTDDQAWDALGYTGNDIIRTPAMDELAGEGAYFSQSISTTPICSASRASIFSGKYERSHRYGFQSNAIREEFMSRSYPVELKKLGYYTGFFGKFGVQYPESAGLFDEFDSYDRNGKYDDHRGYFYKTINGDTVHLTRFTGQQALDFIDQAPDGQPFCLSLSFSAPHAHDPASLQYFWRKELEELYADVTIPDPVLSDDKYFDQLPEMVREGFNRTRWYWRYDTPEKYQQNVKGYYRMISGIDLELAGIREKLREKRLEKNTVIILMGDNGMIRGDRKITGKWLMYDQSVRVPLIIYDPRFPAHKEISQFALNIDIPSTMVDMAGGQVPEEWHGKSLVPLLTSPDADLCRDTILIEHLWEFAHIPPSEGVRTAEWKYFRYINDRSVEELYYLKEDPLETRNLIDDPGYMDKANEFRAWLERAGKRYGDTNSTPPYGLMTDFVRQSERTEIVNPRPGFSWIISPESGFQKSYQILVADEEEVLNNNVGNVWDSGERRSSENSNVSYVGDPLQAGKRYYWKVRIWDNHHRLTDYSEARSFIVAGKQAGEMATPDVLRSSRENPVELSRPDRNLYLADFGKDAFGSLMIQIRSTRKRKVTVRLGEQLTDGRINRNPGGTIRYREVEIDIRPGQNIYQIELPADKRNTSGAAVLLPDSVGVVMPFRYVEVEGRNIQLEKGDLIRTSYHIYWEEEAGSFLSSDTVLNHIWDICKYTIKATSFLGYYVDGDRERIPYEADAYLNQLTHYAVDRSYPMARKTIEYLMEYPTWPTEWQLHMALMFYADYMYTGDTGLIKKYYEVLKVKTLSKLARADGLISVNNVTSELMKALGFEDPKAELRDIVDWPPAQKDTEWNLATEEGERDGYVFRPINTVVNAFYYKNLEIMAEFAEMLGKDEEADEYRSKAAQLKNTFNQILFDPDSGHYVDGEGTRHGSLHANILPLAMGLVPAQYQKSVVKYIKSRGMACSVYGAQYLLDGLYLAGEADYALEMMSSQGDRSWWNMIRSGATMTMEAWDMKYKPNADWNHAWAAVPGNIIVRRMWGIRPKTPGGSILTMQPQLAGLTESSVRAPFLRGEVASDFRKINQNTSQYRISVPGNVMVDFYAELSDGDSVFVNGKPTNPSGEFIRLFPGENVILVKFNSY